MSRAARDDSQFDDPMTKRKKPSSGTNMRNWPRRKLGVLAENADKVKNLLAKNLTFATFAIISGKQLRKLER